MIVYEKLKLMYNKTSKHSVLLNGMALNVTFMRLSDFQELILILFS